MLASGKAVRGSVSHTCTECGLMNFLEVSHHNADAEN